MIEIRRAEITDIPNIMRFIDEHWKKNHILARDRDFFNWMFVEEDKCNFVIAIDSEEDKIYGINGFMVYNDLQITDVAGCMWKTIKSGNPILGLEISEYRNKLLNFRADFGVGLSEKAIKIAELTGEKCKKLQHFYILNQQKKQYKIAMINYIYKTHQIEKNLKYSMSEIKTYDEFDFFMTESFFQKRIPYKSKKYIKHRYFDSPIYQYKCYLIENKVEKLSQYLIFGREVAYNGAKIFKIIDMFGEDTMLSQVSMQLFEWIKKNDWEYVDLYCYGVNNECLRKAGFHLRDEEDTNVIPNYFEPFEQKNVDIVFCEKELERYCLFRGDGDQDRPN